MKIIAALIVALVAVPVGADGWRKNCAEDDETTGTIVLTVGDEACYVPESETDDSTSGLSIGGCKEVDIFYWNDTDGDGTAGTVTFGPRLCPSKTVSGTLANECWLIENTTLTGNAGAEALYGASGGSDAAILFFDAGGTENDGDTQKAMVSCKGSR